MSKVANYYMEMDELSNDAEYQDYLAEIAMKEQDLEEMAKEEAKKEVA